jgi:hypothetical protein
LSNLPHTSALFGSPLPNCTIASEELLQLQTDLSRTSEQLDSERERAASLQQEVHSLQRAVSSGADELRDVQQVRERVCRRTGLYWRALPFTFTYASLESAPPQKSSRLEAEIGSLQDALQQTKGAVPGSHLSKRLFRSHSNIPFVLLARFFHQSLCPLAPVVRAVIVNSCLQTRLRSCPVI